MELSHVVHPEVRRHVQSLQNRGKVLSDRSSLAAANLAARPVQQFQILCRRHPKEALVAAVTAAFVDIEARLSRALLQINGRQVPSTTLPPAKTSKRPDPFDVFSHNRSCLVN